MAMPLAPVIDRIPKEVGGVEEDTVLTHSSSMNSFTPDNPVYPSRSRKNSDGEDDQQGLNLSPPQSTSSEEQEDGDDIQTNNRNTSSPGFFTHASSLSDGSHSEDRPSTMTMQQPISRREREQLMVAQEAVAQQQQKTSHHLRKHSTVEDLQPPGFFRTSHSAEQLMEQHYRETHKTTETDNARLLGRGHNEKQQHPQQDKEHLPVIIRLLHRLSKAFFGGDAYNDHRAGAAWIGFWALLHVTCANYMLTPMRDAVALAVGVKHMPTLTLASTGLAVVSSVPIGWLFEAPDPKRRKLWKRMGLTRGETQGTSLALFYRFFALTLLSYAVGFQCRSLGEESENTVSFNKDTVQGWLLWAASLLWHSSLGHMMYVAFFLVVHLMKLHSLSLVWGVTTEAMEYEEHARNRRDSYSRNAAPSSSNHNQGSMTRLQRLAFVGFGGTLGGILGSIIASTTAHVLHLSGLLVVAAFLLELSAELSIELGRIMQKHWEEEKHYKSTDDLTSLCDSSMKRSQSMESMKRVASGNSLNASLRNSNSNKSLSDLSSSAAGGKQPNNSNGTDNNNNNMTIEEQMNDNSFTQRLMRGITTILRSRLLMAIFTYNALYASTSVLLSFQRAELVVNRNKGHTASTTEDTAFLAKINMASSVAVFALQASGMGASIAHRSGPRGTLALIPLIRMGGVLGLAWWHVHSGGQPPNLTIFLILDECTRVINFAVAKPVRESLWRGLSNEARYEAKPIVDTLANRWGGGSAAFLVSCLDKTIDLTRFGTVLDDGKRSILGFSPNLLLCIIVAVW
eukprot:CAMPEP_0195287676 /NCGR_PEP_ID=MMETSP0707-20130614/4645_1 /TAXON_ID=33640 /ORGANISM="Asterionellopsis glacialis, Strain CCMP134" /LENGTH=793 /DNA_ID=CAMNT_0040347457 /DNA_START=422 /DNA_END=2800 /DNA_ORIENTATION=+